MIYLRVILYNRAREFRGKEPNMSLQKSDPNPLFLTAEEAMGLLDLCIMSQTDFDRDREGILLKLSALVREHLSVLEETTNYSLA